MKSEDYGDFQRKNKGLGRSVELGTKVTIIVHIENRRITIINLNLGMKSMGSENMKSGKSELEQQYGRQQRTVPYMIVSCFHLWEAFLVYTNYSMVKSNVWAMSVSPPASASEPSFGFLGS